MPCRSAALSLFFILFLRVRSISLNHARSFSRLPFDLPEIDGSAVDPCRFFSDPKSTTATAATTTATTTTTTATTTTLVTRKQVVFTTKKPTVQSPPRKPDTKHTRTPIRPQPAPAGPITDSHSNSINSLLYYLLANSRQHAAGPLPGFNSFISQPIGGPPHRGYSTSESDELAATLLKRVGRREEKRWETGSSEDSSDES